MSTKKEAFRALGFPPKKKSLELLSTYLQLRQAAYLPDAQAPAHELTNGAWTHLSKLDNIKFAMQVVRKRIIVGPEGISPPYLPKLRRMHDRYPFKLHKIGIRNIVPHRKRVEETEEKELPNTITVEQPYIKDSFVIDWMKDGRQVEEITRLLIRNFAKPVLDHAKKNGRIDASIDMSLNNFFYTPKMGLWCFDLFPPLLRKELKEIQEQGFNDNNINVNPDPKELEYNRFTTAGFMHRFVQRGLYRILADFLPPQSEGDDVELARQRNAQRLSRLRELINGTYDNADYADRLEALEKRLATAHTFLRVSNEELAPYLKRDFRKLARKKGNTAQRVALRPYSAYTDTYLKRAGLAA